MSEIKTIADILSSHFPKLTPENDAEIDRWEQEQQKTEKLRRYRATVPERYWKESLGTFRADTPEQKTAREAVIEYMREIKSGAFRTLILLGEPGTGKTHLACGILREFGGVYKLSSEMCSDISMARSFTAKKTEAEVIASYAEPELLVIDEIGRGYSGELEQYTLYQIVNARYNRRRKTVIIGNYDKKSFLSYVGQATADRLIESARTVEITGRSYRMVLRRQ